MPNYAWSHFKLSRVKTRGLKPHITGKIWFHGGGSLVLGSGVVFDASNCPIELHVMKGAKLTIGDGARISSGVSIEVVGAVNVGEGCQIGAFCKILDANMHPIRGKRLVAQESHVSGLSPVNIGAGAVLEERVILLPGAQLSANVRALAHSVISRAAPPNAIMRGCPARLIGRSEETPQKAISQAVVAQNSFAAVSPPVLGRVEEN